MSIRRQRIAGNASAFHPPPCPTISYQAEARHHDQGQHDAVATQLHGLPTVALAPQLPAFGVSPERGESSAVAQKDIARHDPKTMSQAQRHTKTAQPWRYIEPVKRDKRQCLGCKVCRQ